MAKNVLKAWPVDNTVTTDDKADKIFSLAVSYTHLTLPTKLEV